MWWQATAALGSLVIALPAVIIGVLAFRRTARSEEVEDRVQAIEAEARRRVDAAQVGLQYMERALAVQQAEITRQQGEIGELRGQLTACNGERDEMRAEIAELRRAVG
jgi:chromosome segregation ATPase